MLGGVVEAHPSIRTGTRPAIEPLIPPRFIRLRGICERRAVQVAATTAVWAVAAYFWTGLYRSIDHAGPLGYDLLAAWRAVKVFAHGGHPYSVKAFLYPPSSLLILRPIAGLSAQQVKIGGLVATMVVAIVSVMISAAAIGRSPFGMTAAVTVLVLRFTQALVGELVLENVTVLCFAALAIFFLCAIRGRWIPAGAAIGISMAIKPMLVPVLLVFLMARRWRGLWVAIALPVALNLVALALVRDPTEIFTKLPSLLNRVGVGVTLNSAWVDVARMLGLPDAATIAIRVVTAVLSLGVAYLAWTRINDERLRLVTASSALLIGAYLSGTLSEYHFMLTLAPFAMTVVIPRSLMRLPPMWLAIAWIMGRANLPRSILGLGLVANQSAYRAFGMSLVLVTSLAALAFRSPLRNSAPEELPEQMVR